jgi:RNA polymerase sigma-70 factor (ECF subfamily)
MIAAARVVVRGKGVTVTGPMTTTDEREFRSQADRHRREIHVHCYRMLGSFHDAEDLVQETMMRAWQNRASYDEATGGPGFRAWLYRIATNACLDALKSKRRRVAVLTSFAEVPWLEPYPDRLLDEVAGPETPDDVAVKRETIALGYLAMIQLLPARQRAMLILHDVLGWSAQETAELLETSVTAINSGLQRARATLQRSTAERGDLTGTPEPTERERALLAGFIDAHERMDMAASIALMREDMRVTMPPQPFIYQGVAQIAPLFAQAAAMGQWRLVAAWANRQPAAVSYLRRPGDSALRAFKIDVLRIRDGLIAEITTFMPTLIEMFGLPDILNPTAAGPAR